MNNAALIENTASRMHEAWQQNYIAGQEKKGKPTERWKPTGGADLTQIWKDKVTDMPATGEINGRELHGRITIGNEGKKEQEVDIAHTAYRNLPENWQKENRDSATHAVGVLNQALERFSPDQIQEAFEQISQSELGTIEKGSALDFLKNEAGPSIHEAWLGRNTWVKPNDPLLNPFNELPHEEQLKDLEVLKTALEVHMSNDRRISR